MKKPNILPVRSRRPLVPHESLDAYWFAQMLRCRALRVVVAARCKSTIGRRLDSALGRVTRFIVEAADGAPEKVGARLERARATIGLALSYFDDLALRRGVREVVIVDLRERASQLLERLEMLGGEVVEAWPTSNCLPTVLDEVRHEGSGGGLDVVAVVAMLAAAAVRELPEPVVAADDGRGREVDSGNGRAPTLLREGSDAEGATPVM